MTDQNSTTPQPDDQPSAAQPTQKLPVAGPASAHDAAAEQTPNPARSSAPVPAPNQPPAAEQPTTELPSTQQPTTQYPAAPRPEAQQSSAQQPPQSAAHHQGGQHTPGQHAPGQHPTAQYPTSTHSQGQGSSFGHAVPVQQVSAGQQGPGSGGSPAYVNPYSAPATVTEEKPRRNRAWVPVVSAAAAAALLASLGTAGALTLAGDRDGSASLADVGQSNSQNVPVKSSTVENPDWTAVTSAVQDSVVAIQVESQAGGAEGSGVVLDSQGQILTNNHVVADASTVQVTLGDGRVYEADIVGTDPTTDLAVVQLTDPPSDLTPATFADSSDVVVGEPVMALGNPLGLANTATTGIVSALNRPVTASGEDGGDQVVTNAIQIDAAVNPGNSGGPLFNASGEVIGITSSIATMSGGASSGGSGSIGLGFAIPSNLASQIGDQLKKDGTAEHAFLGVSMSDATATADGVTRRGAGVAEVVSGSPAGDAGIQKGDVIVAIDDSPVNGAASLTAYVREKEAGDKAVLTVVRDGKAQEVTVTLAVKDESADQGSGQQGQQGQQDEQGQQGQQGQGGSDQSQPDNIPDWMRDLFGNQG